MYIFLQKKNWGYQTICPNEENTKGLYQVKYKNYPSHLNVWTAPSFLSYTYKKVINQHNETWKHDMLKSQFKPQDKTKKDIDDLFGFMYDFLDNNNNVVLTLSENVNIRGWDYSKDENGIEWIKISKDKEVWMPFK